MTHPKIDQQITFLYTLDLEKTAHFYEQIMHLPLVVDQGSCRIYRVTAEAYVGFCQRDSAPEEPKGIIFTLVTDAVDEWYDHLVQQGVTPEEPPQDNPNYNIYHFFVKDPNGYLVEVQRFWNENWHQPL